MNSSTESNASSCSIKSIILDESALVTIIGDDDIILLNFSPSIYGNATLSFNHITPGQITNVILPYTSQPAFLEFNGDYNVVGGEVDNVNHIPRPLVIYDIKVVLLHLFRFRSHFVAVCSHIAL